jgi:hypothetical protein
MRKETVSGNEDRTAAFSAEGPSREDQKWSNYIFLNPDDPDGAYELLKYLADLSRVKDLQADIDTSLEQELAKRPSTCPHCGSGRVALRVWGYPVWTPGLERSGDVVLGGCVLPAEPTHQWRCRNCGCEWR